MIRQLILASKSPRRRELLASMGIPLSFVDIVVDEYLNKRVPTKEIAENIAKKKSESFDINQLLPNQVLVTADTIVICDDQVLGKPHDRNEAVQMLKGLSGKWHDVCTGVCLTTLNRKHSFTETSRVHVCTLNDEEIGYYVDNYRPYDKAGSYGIQEWFGLIAIDRIEGCYYNVMGLPTSRLYHELLLLDE